MGQSYKNNNIRTSILNSCFLDGYSDKVPHEIEDKIRLNVDVSPIPKTIIFNATATLNTEQDFYVTGYSWGVCANGVGGSITAYGSIFIDGVQYNLFQVFLSCGTLNDAIAGADSQTFNIPIKVDRGSQIVLNNGTVFGYYVDKTVYDTGVTK
jgi:hypothetical protein